MNDDNDDAVAPSDEPIAAVILKRRAVEEAANPDIRMVDSVILKDGPRVYRVATHWMIVNRHAGELHHHAIKLTSYRKEKGGWKHLDEHSITIDDQEGDEISTLATFLGVAKSADVPDSPGDYVVIPVLQEEIAEQSVHQLLDAIAIRGKAKVMAHVLAMAQGDAEVLRALVDTAVQNPDATRQAAAALTLANYSKALRKLEELIVSDAGEKEFQKHLSQNPWMFGSEYSELLDRRIWTRDEHQDFVLRRTADGYLEIIEIKTPLGGEPLFLRDTSHDTYYARREVSVVIGQVLNYLELLDADRDKIRARDGEDVGKIRAKIIIGRDADDNQRAALRRFNGHLHRIEILTFDQLLKIARQVIATLEHVVFPASHDV